MTGHMRLEYSQPSENRAYPKVLHPRKCEDIMTNSPAMQQRGETAAVIGLLAIYGIDLQRYHDLGRACQLRHDQGFSR